MAPFGQIEKIGIVCRGKSIKRIGEVYNKFEDVLIVNNFDAEFEITGKYLQGKHNVQMVNKLTTAIATKDHYRILGIKEAILSRSYFQRKHIMGNRAYLENFGIKCYYIPEELYERYLYTSKKYTPERRKKIKFGNTGVLAVIYAAEIVKAKTVFIVGMDFYQKDYYKRYPHQYPLKMMKKRGEVRIIPQFMSVVDNNPKTTFVMVTGCKIKVSLYDKVIGQWRYPQLDTLKNEIKHHVQFIDIPIYFNGEQINTPCKHVNWDEEDEDAYYSFGHGLDLSIYNLCAFVMKIPVNRAGVSGVVVSKKQLKVNFARNDIQSDCEVYQRIQEVIKRNRVKKLAAEIKL